MLTQGGSCRCFTSGDDDRQREEDHRSWLKTLPPGSMIGMEASGCYHQCLADRAAALGFTVYVLNPKDVAYYAKALGQRGKTDRLDARTIARYLAHEGHDLHPYGPPTARQREIAALLQRRAALVKHAVALEQSLSGAGFLKREARRARAALRDLVTAVERQLQALLAENPALEERRQASAIHRRCRTSPTSWPKAFPRPLLIAHWPEKSSAWPSLSGTPTPPSIQHCSEKKG